MNDRSYQLAAQLGAVLSAGGATVTTAESCTGGGLAAALTAVAGSSVWFEGGLVTYSNRLKSKFLDVPPDVLRQHGAVSEAVVAAMVDGAVSATNATVAAAISGIAGPDGGSEDKPVGTVCIAVGNSAHKHIFTAHFSGDRSAVREQSVVCALEMLVKWVNENQQNTV